MTSQNADARIREVLPAGHAHLDLTPGAAALPPGHSMVSGSPGKNEGGAGISGKWPVALFG